MHDMVSGSSEKGMFCLERQTHVYLIYLPAFELSLADINTLERTYVQEKKRQCPV